jgi:protein-L-isoaspartate(D-aspartate) O-methyltransferase
LLARTAGELLPELGCGNVQVVAGRLAAGHAAGAPYDLIVIEGATEVVPTALLEQLADGGRLACILGRGPAGKATLYRRSDGDIGSRPIFDAAAPLLPGFAQPPAFVF